MSVVHQKTLSFFSKFIVEFFMIVLAVLLALGADQWMQAKKGKERANILLERIYYEVKNNRSYLVRTLELRQDTINNFDKKLLAMKELDILSSSDEERATLGHFAPFQPWNAAWTLAEASDELLQLDYSTALSITSVYSLQKSYSEFSNAYLMGVAFDLDYMDDSRERESRQSAAMAIYTLIRYEQSLLKAYDEALKQITPKNR